MVRMLTVFVILLVSSACASPRLMRCGEKEAHEAGLYSCPSSIDGLYRLCEKPKDIYRCKTPD